MSIAPGSRLGPYSITAPIGAGGMGEVYRAHDARLQRDVAIKVLPREFATDLNRMARFAREAQLLAALSHPNIAGIYGLEESGGASALVMEFVDGPTLAERIALGVVPVEEAIGIARQIAEALEAAHDKGIIHRDLKPANIKITPEGKVKVLDFGLAKAMEADPISGGSAANSPTLTVQATRAGQIMGTAAYMAPEQARGKSVDRRADIWAFGVVLFEMLTGASMFEGETVSDTLAAVLRAEIDLKRLPADTPPRLRRLIARCLERDPKKRLRDIGDAWIEFDAPEEAPAAVVAAPAWRKWAPWAAAIVAAGAGIAWGVLRTPAPQSRQVLRFAIESKSATYFASLSADGSMVAWSAGAATNMQLMLRRMDQMEAKPVAGAEGGVLPVFSPDGQWLVFSTLDNKLKKIPITGGTPVQLADTTTFFGGAWLDDDTIVVGSPKGLRRITAGGGAVEDMTSVGKGETGHMHPQALPGGRVLFTVAENAGFDQAHAAVFDLKTKKTRPLIRTGLVTRYLPSGHLVYGRGGTLFAMPFDLDRMAAAGPETPVAEGISGEGPPGFVDYAISANGLLAYVPGAAGHEGTTLGWADRKGETDLFAPDPALWGTGRLSPDGSHVANAITKASARDVWNYDIARRTSIRLSFDGSADFPIWSPDGRRIFYSSSKAGAHGIYSVAADGSGKAEVVLAFDTGGGIPTSFTPDGKTLVFTRSTPDQRIHVLPIGGQARSFHETTFREGEGEVSPDGKWLAYTSAESGTNEVYVQPFPGPGPKVRVSPQSGAGPRWARNGRELFYREGALPTMRVMAVDVQTGAQGFQAGAPRPLFALAMGSTWDVAPDGKRFLVEITRIASTSSGRIQFVSGFFEELRRRAPARK